MGKTIIVLMCGMLSVVSYLFAQGTQQQGPQKEEIILTTYYPTPYGDYERMRVNRISVGDTNGDGQRTAEDLPAEDGQLRVAKSVIYEPQQGSISGWERGKRGEVAYSGAEDSFYYYNGSEWVAQGGGGSGYTAYGTTECLTGYRTAYTGWAFFSHYLSGNNAGLDCMQGDLPSRQGLGFGAWNMWVQGNDHFTWPGAGDPDRISCAVCVK